jgi:hypothetical protein
MTTRCMHVRAAVTTKPDCQPYGAGGGKKHAQGRPRLRFQEGGGIKAPLEKSTSIRSSATKVIVADLGAMYIEDLTGYPSRLENQL